MISFDLIEIHQRPYDQLIELLSKETKLNFYYYRKNFIERRIKSRMIRVGCYTLKSYYNYILSNKEQEIKKFLDSFNINYSYFFRNWEVFDLFQTLFLKSLDIEQDTISYDLKPNPANARKRNSKKKKKTSNPLESHQLNRIYSETSLSFLKYTSLYYKIKKWKKKQVPINIWSCPCASGEEPYSIAMILNNLKSQIRNFPDYNIIASDIDQKAIIKAEHGSYKKESVRDISKYFENKYFSKVNDYIEPKYLVDNEIKKEVKLVQEDVTKGHTCSLKYDIIFCRYLLIYFDRDNRDKFIKIIENQLNEGGLLILGKTETLFHSESNLKLVNSRDHIYMKY